MGNKTTYLNKLQQHMTNLIVNALQGEDDVSIYFKRGYNSGGGDVITDQDAAVIGQTASSVANSITLLQNLYKFRSNDNTLVDADYDATFQQFRSDK